MHDDDKIERLRLATRGYEVAAEGRVSPAQYLRYLEHQRWSTITRSEKLPLRRYWMLGVVRAQELEIHVDIGFFVELELTMWMSRLGRTSASFSHEIRRVDDDALVARNTATIVALDSERRPSPIDPAAGQYLLQRDVVRGEKLDGVPPPGAWERTVDLRPSDHDLQSHVNQARYGDLIEDTRLLAAEAGGYGPGPWNDRVRRFSIAYEQEARAGDPVRARTWRTEGRERSLDFVLVRGETVLTRARVEVGSDT